MGLIGHELRHTIEVLSDPMVTSGHAMSNFYQLRGSRSAEGRFETQAAIDRRRSRRVRRWAQRSGNTVPALRSTDRSRSCVPPGRHPSSLTLRLKPVAAIWKPADGARRGTISSAASARTWVRVESPECRSQGLAGSTRVLRSSGAASGEIMNLIIARAASGAFEAVNTATLDGHGLFRNPGSGPT